MRRYLIVNADDFGASAGVNRGIARAHEDGIVTSASLMVTGRSAADAAAYARAHAEMSVGLHVDLGEWAYECGRWIARRKVVDTSDAGAVAREVGRQLEAFRRLGGRDPSHVDSHQHVHRSEPAASVLDALAAELGVPLRGRTPQISFCGDFYAQTSEGAPLPDAVTVDALVALLRALPTGVSELSCHPALDDDMDSVYGSERERELETLCDPRVRAALDAEAIELRSFRDFT